MRKIQRGLIKAVVIDFHVDTIMLMMEKYGKSPEIAAIHFIFDGL